MLPSSIEYGTITGRFMEAVIDSADADLFPDGVPASGSVTFTPAVSRVVITGGDTEPMTVILQPIQAKLDDEGYVSSPTGERYINLVSGQSPDMIPSDFTYRVDIRVGRMKFEPFDIEVPANTVIDLAEQTPVMESPGVIEIVNKTLYDDAMAAVQEALSSVRSIDRIEDDDGDGIATIHYTDGTTDSIALPQPQNKEG